MFASWCPLSRMAFNDWCLHSQSIVNISAVAFKTYITEIFYFTKCAEEYTMFGVRSFHHYRRECRPHVKEKRCILPVRRSTGFWGHPLLFLVSRSDTSTTRLHVGGTSGWEHPEDSDASFRCGTVHPYACYLKRVNVISFYFSPPTVSRSTMLSFDFLDDVRRMNKRQVGSQAGPPPSVFRLFVWWQANTTSHRPLVNVTVRPSPVSNRHVERLCSCYL